MKGYQVGTDIELHSEYIETSAENALKNVEQLIEYISDSNDCEIYLYELVPIKKIVLPKQKYIIEDIK